MGKLVKNENLNYWLCGLIFVVVFLIVLGAIELITGVIGAVAGILGLIAYIIIMPYVAGRLVDYVSDRWMD